MLTQIPSKRARTRHSCPLTPVFLAAAAAADFLQFALNDYHTHTHPDLHFRIFLNLCNMLLPFPIDETYEGKVSSVGGKQTKKAKQALKYSVKYERKLRLCICSTCWPISQDRQLQKCSQKSLKGSLVTILLDLLSFLEQETKSK